MLIDGSADRGRILFGHGAGVGMNSPFMTELTIGLAALDFEVVRYEFPYMQKTRTDGRRRPPDRMPKLIEYLAELTERFADAEVPLYLAGKSMGGRVSSLVLEQSPAIAALVFGYPFHAPGKTEPRTEHLAGLNKPLHIFQGSRDPMGTREEVASYALSDSVNLYWLEDGNHDLKPRKVSGYSQADHLAWCLRQIDEILP